MKFLFVGPFMRAGIGFVTRRYAEHMNSEYCIFNDTPKEKEYDVGFAFLIPETFQIEYFNQRIVPICKRIIVMTVCETETVHPNYKVFLNYQPVYCPSEFSANILQRQFGGEWKVLRHLCPSPPPMKPIKRDKYVFYTIGNILEYRKNIKLLLEAFIRLNLPDSILVMKATCREDAKIPIKLPRVHIIDQLLTDSDMEKLHADCDCYINCSYSEGVGMGAVEAAARNKPVIITDYGGLKEYVKTPYMVKTTPAKVGMRDFLFEADMIWGKPSLEDLMKHMKECYDLRIRDFDHEHTRNINKEVDYTLSSIFH
jgi:glycosyltransferase involved in cell wall biosynthesis